MKAIKLILFIFLLPITSLVAQDEGPVAYKNILKFSPGHLADNTFMLSYERMIKNNEMSIMASIGVRLNRPDYFYYDYVGSNNGLDKGILGELQWRVYVVKPSETPLGKSGKGAFYFKGLYAGPFASYRFLNINQYYYDDVLQASLPSNEKISEVSGGVLLGIQLAMFNRLYLDLYTGGGIRYSSGANNNNYYGITEPGYTGVIPKGGLQLGITF